MNHVDRMTTENVSPDSYPYFGEPLVIKALYLFLVLDSDGGREACDLRTPRRSFHGLFVRRGSHVSGVLFFPPTR